MAADPTRAERARQSRPASPRKLAAPRPRHERTLPGRCAAYAEAMPDDESRPARVEDVHELALAMPVYPGTGDNPIFQVSGKSFIFFRNSRPDAVDPETGNAIGM